MSKDRAKGKGGGLLDIEDMGITFDDEGYVDVVENIDLSAAWKIKPNKDKTRTRGKELNLLQQLFMNVGRFAGAGQQGPSGPNGPGPNGS